MRSARLQFAKNRLANLLLFPAQTRVPEPKFLDAHGSQKGGSLDIVRLLARKSVSAAVEFNREVRFRAKEIQKVNSDRMSATEFVGAEPSVAQPSPNEFFGPRRFLAQSASAFDVGHEQSVKRSGNLGRNCVNDRPHPGPLPRGEGEYAQRSGDAGVSGFDPFFSSNKINPKTETATLKFSDDIPRCSLSSGERVGVRASVKTILCSALLFCLGFVFPLHADDVITNVMSPIVSYQYPDDFNSQALTNGGIISPIVSYQYFEWPGDDVLQLLSSARVSYFYPGNDGLQIFLQGRVTDTGGVPLAGAVISVAFGTLTLAQTTTDGNGNYTIPLGANVYALTASASGHAKSSRVLTLSAGTATQNFQLASLPATPGMTPVNRQPAAFVFPPIGSLGEILKVFNGSVFVNIEPANSPSPGKMTIVLTHGWIPQALGYEVPNAGTEGWPTTIANAMKAQGVTTDVANILALDWRYAAQGTLPPEENIPGEGVFLGQSLQRVLGNTYAQPVHFMGHSLGAQVNAAAANYLHGDRTAQQPVSPTPWTAAPTHMTLFDHAEISRIASAQVLWDGLTMALKKHDNIPILDVLKYAAKTLQGWKPSLPVQYEWADNYISQVGFYLPNTLNVALQKAEGYAGIQFWQAHSYPMTWYNLSVGSPTDPANPLGFKRSYEYSQLPGVSLPFPPSIAELSPGDAYHQTPAAFDQLALEPLPLQNYFQLIVPLFGNGADAVVQGVEGTIQIVGDVAAEVRDTAAQAGEWITQGFNSAGNAALQGGQTLVNLYNSGVLRLTLHTRPASVQRPLALRNGPSPLDGGGTSNAPPMAWLPIQFPSNATAMAFDFTVEGNPVDDLLVCGIGTNNLFSLEAKYIPTNTISASRLIDVSVWAGTTNELFFGFLGGTSTNATLTIENIRFFSLAEPRLEVSVNGNMTLLSWPLTAGGYVLETTPTLALPIWETVTNAPVISADRYVLTNSWSDQSRFFHLRQQ